MTNWMTAAGLALMAGGIATLVGFRHVLLPGSEPVARGERRRGGPPFTVPAQIRARRRRQVLAALPAAPSRAAIEPVRPAGDADLVPAAAAPVSGPAPLRVGDPTGRMAAAPGRGPAVAPVSGPAAASAAAPGATSATSGATSAAASAAAPGATSATSGATSAAASAATSAARRMAARTATARSAIARSASGRSGRNAKEDREPGTTRGRVLPARTERVAETRAERRARQAGAQEQTARRADAHARETSAAQAGARDASARRAGARDLSARRAGARDTSGSGKGIGGLGRGLGEKDRADGPTHAVDGRFVPREHVIDEPTGPVSVPIVPNSMAAKDPSRIAPREGDRIEGWVRPQYQDDVPATGDYWTPVPESYGWPTPVQRLPQAPPYPPRFDQVGAASPGAASAYPEQSAEESGTPGPQWPPAQPGGRIELPRGWSDRNVQQRPVRRAPREASADEPESPQRPRPRPRPRPAPGGQPERSTVYRSRHAADPS